MLHPAILTKENLRQKAPTFNLALGIASPTQDLCSSQYVKELIPSYASYLLIPSTPTPLLYNTQQILLGVLPHAKNILLDIALPFSNRGNQFEQGYYFGRYLIFNQRLIGVRLSCSTKTQFGNQVQTYKKWPTRKTCNYRVPKSILQFYKSNKFQVNSYEKQIKIGDFILSFNNVKVHILFESQLRNIQNLLNDCKCLGADIISVVNDVPREKMVEGKLRSSNFSCPTTVQNQLKQYGRNNKKIVMYAGCKTAPLTELYLTNPFILHHQLPEIKMEPHFLNDGGTLTVVCNIEINRKEFASSRPSITKQMPYLFVNSTIREIKTTLPGKSKKLYPKNSGYYGPIPQSMQDILKKMHFWYLYCSINQKQPFIIPLPLQPLAQVIVQQLKEISKYTSRPLNNFLSFYKTSNQCIVGQEQEGIQIVIYESFADLIAKNQRLKYFFYTDNPQQVQLLTKAAENNSKIFICQKALLMEEQMEKNRQMETIQKKIMNFSDKILDEGIYSLKKIFQENRQSSQPLSKDQLIVAIHQNLKTKIRSSLRCHPFYRYLLNLNRRQLQEAFGQVEIHALQQERKTNLFQNENKKMQSTSFLSGQQQQNNRDKDKSKDFHQKLDFLKKIYSQDKKLGQPQCHRCQKFMPKSFMKQCLKCKLKTCYLCVQSIRGKNLTLQIYKQCIVCKKICYCSVCTQKKKKNLLEKDKILSSSIEIRNLSLSQPQKTLQQLQQLKILRDLQINACQICQIQGREVQYVKIVCSQCDNSKCFNCVKSQHKDRQFVKNWLCNKCKPPEPQKMIEQQKIDQVMSNKDEPNLSPISGSKQIQKRVNKRAVRFDQNQQDHTKQDNRKGANSYGNKNQSNRRSPSQSHSPIRNTRQTSNNNANTQPSNNFKKQKAKSPSHSPSPPRNKKAAHSPSHSVSPPIQKKTGPAQSSQPKENSKQSQNINNKKNRPHSPSQSRSASRPKQNNKQGLQKKPTNQRPKRSLSKSQSPIPNNIQKKKQRARSPSNSDSPKINRGNNSKKPRQSSKSPPAQKQDQKKISKKKSPSHSNSPVINKKNNEKKKARSPSHSPSPVRQKNVAEKKAVQNTKDQQNEAKVNKRQRPRSPSNSGSSVQLKKNKKSNSRSRSRSPKKQNKYGQSQEGGISKPLWGKRSNQNQSDYTKNNDGNRESQNRNSSYHQNNYNQGNHQNRQYNDQGRTGYNQNRQGSWRGRGQERGRGDRGRGGFRGRNYDQNRPYQQQQENGSRNYGNRQDNSSRNHNKDYQQGNGNNTREEGQVQANILSVNQASNQDIDY